MSKRSARLLLLPSLLVAALCPAPPSLAEAELVSFGSSWSYVDHGSDQGTAWRALGFDDASWSTGAAAFGYGFG